MSSWELFEIWLIVFFTLALFSFLYKDNPVYRIAEHIFAGLTAGYQVGLIWDTVILQQLWDPMMPNVDNWFHVFISLFYFGYYREAFMILFSGNWWLFIPGILGFLMFTRLTRNFSWVSRVSLAFVMGVTAGIFIISQLHGLVLPQMQNTMVAPSKIESKFESLLTDNLGTIEIVDLASSQINNLDIGIDTASGLTLAESDTTSIDGNETQADTLTSEETVDSVVYPYLHPESDNSIFAVYKKTDENPIKLSAMFIDTTTFGIFDFYAPSFKIRKQGTATDIELVRADVYSNNGLEIIRVDDTTYNVSYDFYPDTDLEPGVYSLAVEVRQRSVMIFLAIIIVLGVISTLIYFYFSHEHKGILGVTAKVGIWFIMISFGAHFGYTVMGRVSLLIGRVQYMTEHWLISIILLCLIIIMFIIMALINRKTE